MPNKITIETLGEEQFKKTLSRFTEGLTDLAPVWEDVVKRLQSITEERFASKGAGSWAPLSPAYAEWKHLHYPGKPILRRTDALYNSLTAKGSGSVTSVVGNKLKFGTRVRYAVFHQKGIGVPKRKIVELTDDDKRGIVKIFQAYLVKVSKGRE